MRIFCLLSCVIPALVFAAFAEADDAKTLLDRLRGATGIAHVNVRDLDWTVRGKVWDRAGQDAGYVTRRIRVILPQIFRKDQEMAVRDDQAAPRLHTRFYFDGTSGWGSFADMTRFADTPTAALQGADLNMVRKEVRGFWLRLWQAAGTDKFAVTTCGPLTLRFADVAGEEIASIALDPSTGLPVRTGPCSSGAISSTGNYTEILEWTKVHGLSVPLRILNYHGGTIVADIRTVSVKVNTGLSVQELANQTDSK